VLGDEYEDMVQREGRSRFVEVRWLEAGRIHHQVSIRIFSSQCKLNVVSNMLYVALCAITGIFLLLTIVQDVKASSCLEDCF